MDTTLIQKKLAALKGILQTKRDEIIQAKAQKAQLEESIKEKEDELIKLGITDMNKIDSEIAQLEKEINEGTQEVEDTLAKWQIIGSDQ